MKIDDKEIEKLLEDFDGENINVPYELDEKLNVKLKELKPKEKYKKWISVLVASLLIISVSYSVVPSFKTFGDTVFKYIFGDIGVENAVNFGYVGSKKQNIKIGDYNIRIENMYIDNLRISFDAIIENDVENMPGRSSMYVEGLESDEITINNGVFYKEDKKLKANVLIVGDGVAKIIKNKNELEVELKLVKHNNTKDEILGKSKMTIEIPKEMKISENIEINKSIKEKNLNFNIEKIEASPTMMYLYTSGKVKGIGNIQGIYNFKIISHDGELYKENIALAGMAHKNGYKQSIVPSVYYDKSKTLNLKAEGVLVDANKKIKIELNDDYPKVIDYFGTKVTIKEVKYKNNRLVVEVLNNDDIAYMGVSYIDKDSTIEGYYSDSIHGLIFDIDKRDSYDLDLGITLKYKIPINMEIENTLIKK
ncbi:hypothetical protein [Terrisporobacter glycolicus]|uniref:DUF4179 domain-containing protein n=1 Tax=Terrisporobacter glycolicus ATCC 14880 = DSM 1288 TaxID=1121315 RepID=A0ABZ2EPP9_9FIRM|nr:hypothetical protein [Terrisporobacter glycolicus]